LAQIIKEMNIYSNEMAEMLLSLWGAQSVQQQAPLPLVPSRKFNWLMVPDWE